MIHLLKELDLLSNHGLQENISPYHLNDQNKIRKYYFIKGPYKMTPLKKNKIMEPPLAQTTTNENIYIYIYIQ